MASLAALVTRGLGSRPVSASFEAVTGRRLRILAYHGVPDAEPFAIQMQEVAAQWHAVSGADVAAALAGSVALPDRAVWVTFDDGAPSVVEHAMPVLERLAIPATLFVCPGLIEHDSPAWWSVVEAAGPPEGGAGRVTALKQLPDAERRRVVADLAAGLAERGIDLPADQLSRAQLERWVATGREVGNHSWDHPCLDQCTPGDQRDQVRRTHDWLADHVEPPTKLFAYPNGNFSPTVDAELADLRYPVGLLFDHRLARVRPADALRLSRLRVDAAADLDRFRAILSGADSTVFHAGRSVSRLVRR